MDDLIKILCTSSLTLIGGVLLLVITQLIQRNLLDPLTEYNKLRSEIAEALSYYSRDYSNPRLPKDKVSSEEVEQYRVAHNELRKLASKLGAKAYMLPIHNQLTKLKLVPSRQEMLVASSYLIGLSNAVFSDVDPEHISKNTKKIKQLLGLLETDRLST